MNGKIFINTPILHQSILPLSGRDGLSPVEIGLSRSLPFWRDEFFLSLKNSRCTFIRNSIMTKAEIRAKMAAEKKAAGAAALAVLSTGVVKMIREFPEFQKASAVGVYIPIAGEVDVSPLFAAGGKSFFIPAFDCAAGVYRMARWSENLRAGKFGIPEPERPVFASADEMDLILVPGIAFDGAGRRLGRGGGFYDRLLPLYTAPCAGVCFNFQLMDSLPDETHDCRVEFIITELGGVKIRGEC